MGLPLSLLALAVLAAAPAATQQLEGSRVVAFVQQELQARLEAAGSSAKVRVPDFVADQSLPAGVVRMEVGAVAGRWPRARAAVPVRIHVDGHAARPFTVWVEASDVRNVPGYMADYAVGTPGAALRVAPAAIDMVCCDALADGPALALEGKRLRRAVRAGAPVLAVDLEPLPVVTARQKVAVAVERGSVRIVTSGVALQDGAMGERIAVRAQQSNHAVQARVTAQGEVVVDE